MALTGTVPAGGTFVIASNSEAFTRTFGSTPLQDDSGSVNGNGDDAYELTIAVGGSDVVVDHYGEVGIDGKGRNWEYTNGHATRKAAFVSGSAAFSIFEWTVVTEVTASATDILGTLGFTPGVR